MNIVPPFSNVCGASFSVGDQLVPAAEYTMRVVSVTGTLSFRSADGSVSVFINSIPVEKATPESRYKLVFHRYGSHYYVSEIWTPGYRRGRTVMQHPSELKLAKNGEPQQSPCMWRRQDAEADRLEGGRARVPAFCFSSVG